MSEVVSPLAEPNYVARLALRAAPFHEAVDATIFFNGQQIGQSLNLVQHLVSSSDKVAWIHADAGLGKTCLLTQLQSVAQDNLRLSRIQGEFLLDRRTVLFQCLRDFGVDESGLESSEPLKDLLKTRLKQLHQLDLKPVVLIDDADEMQPTVLEELCGCLEWQDDDTYLIQAVITSKRALPALKRLQDRMQRIDLHSIDEQEIATYLLTRMQQVGLQGESPFNYKDIKRFFKQSAGNPAVLNKLAHQKLLGLSLPTTPLTRKVNFSFLLHGISASIIAISLVALLIFQDEINALLPKTSEVPESEIEVLSEVEEELATVTIEPSSMVSFEQSSRDELVELINELDVDVAVPEQEIIEAQKERSVEVIEHVSEFIERDVNETENAWIMQQKSTNYTYQLIGSWKQEEVSAFIEKYALKGDVAEFESLRNGRVWYAVIYGVYENKQAALNASRDWPAPLNTLPSWLRRFDSVQTQISENAQAQ